jgi:hypothetical protein
MHNYMSDKLSRYETSRQQPTNSSSFDDFYIIGSLQFNAGMLTDWLLSWLFYGALAPINCLIWHFVAF